MSDDNTAPTNPFLLNLPAEAKTFPRGLYDRFPTFTPSDPSFAVKAGYSELASKLLSGGVGAKAPRVVAIEGFHGLDWAQFTEQLSAAVNQQLRHEASDTGSNGELLRVRWFQMSDCLAEEKEVVDRISPFLGGDDRVFGQHYPFGPEVFFNVGKVAKARIEASVARSYKPGVELLIVVGTGASLIEQYDLLWYVDIPKDVIQERARAKQVWNLGDGETTGKQTSFSAFYKRMYFVEWPALGRCKEQCLPKMHLFVDLQDATHPTFVTGVEFRGALAELAKTPFRPRPWFYQGVWGGQFMKGHMGLPPDAPNYAWSFELIVTENGIVLSSKNPDTHVESQLEFSFDFLMFQEYLKIQGQAPGAQFKYEWPIRFDYLDTIDGDNLSCQVHPRPQYMRRQFGETYTQDETYYITNAKPNSKVYLGLAKDMTKGELAEVMGSSEKSGEAIDFDQVVHSVPSKPHDLFLIPNGTMHCSGAGNLVLEISSTPYIFTFKMYDYVRKDLEGNMRPMNVDRGSKNVRLERQKDFVNENYVAKAKLVAESGNSVQEYSLYDRPETFYNIHRVEWDVTKDQEWTLDTNGVGVGVNLVEGQQVALYTEARPDTPLILSYLETALIPAEAGKCIIRVTEAAAKAATAGATTYRLLKAFVRPTIGVTENVNDPNDDAVDV